MEGRKSRTFALAALALGVLVLASPARLLWARPEAGWASIFVVWALLIALAFLVSRAGRGP